MKDSEFYNSKQFLILKIEDLQQELKDCEYNYNQAIKEERRDDQIFELGIKIEIVKTKLEYYTERLNNFSD